MVSCVLKYFCLSLDFVHKRNSLNACILFLLLFLCSQHCSTWADLHYSETEQSFRKQVWDNNLISNLGHRLVTYQGIQCGKSKTNVKQTFCLQLFELTSLPANSSFLQYVCLFPRFLFSQYCTTIGELDQD